MARRGTHVLLAADGVSWYFGEIIMIIIVKEHAIYNGKKYWIQSTGRYYQVGRHNDEERLLHRAVWVDSNGPIPQGYVVHHKDHNWRNNSIENLELIEMSQHLSDHMKERYDDPEYVKSNEESLKKAVEAAKEWHQSPEGRKWHSEHGKRSWVNKKKHPINCQVCGKEHMTAFPGRTRFCSVNVKEKARQNGTSYQKRSKRIVLYDNYLPISEGLMSMTAYKDPVICSKIRDRVDKWDKYWTINRSLYYEWIDFVMGDQWREDESKLFERYNKIPLMFNKLGVLMNHLLGDQMANTPSLQIMPDEQVPVKTAEIRAALIKNITLNSDAKTIYQKAFGQAVVGGYSSIIVKTAYLHDESFDQEILFEGVEDPNRCYWDISARTICKTDGMYAGFKTRVSRKKFKDMYGKIEQDIGSSSITEDSTMAFADDDSITQVDDFERIGKKTTIYKLSDDRGSVVDADEFKKLEKRKIDG